MLRAFGAQEVTTVSWGVCFTPLALGNGNPFPQDFGAVRAGMIHTVGDVKTVALRAFGAVSDCCAQAGMSQERAGICAGATSPTNSRPARAPVPHEEAGTR